MVGSATSSLSVSMFLFLGIVLFPAVSGFKAGFSCGRVNTEGMRSDLGLKWTRFGTYRWALLAKVPIFGKKKWHF